ncbi:MULTISPECIES: hypothetical protein [Dyella]|uniref:Uncharacterized protein n=2 Tax=Dyella TaxID=231454 RepID=A0A4R0YDA0_9GAMM|nr:MULTISPECIES: hypothetical protein [Dyella]TBR36329.1 hypothetical protein EYV96_17260 [Dyella terrae]TCI05986.1 hypothetical protein EZM97_36350 [Dyella soli]
MPSTIAELHLSGPYRHAQRALAAWLDLGHAAARRSLFQVRAALAALNAAERHQLARWLAWLAVAQQSRQQATPQGRILRLDHTLLQAMEEAMARLPSGFAQTQTQTRRLSA